MRNALDRIKLFIVFGKEGEDMIAMLWAQRIMNDKKHFWEVPRLLKEQVREILIESGVEELIIEEKPE